MTSDAQPAEGTTVPTYRPREYQLEMLEASLRENIIVAMGTGSAPEVALGFLRSKYHSFDSELSVISSPRAVLRIQRELETCHPDKLIWFLAPTVALCTQQYETICSDIPSVGARLLTGADNLDTWSEQAIWDAALNNIRVVVSTPDVLSDALSHGFVRISQLALIIFDEAHHSNMVPAIVHMGLDIEADPYIRRLTKEPGSAGKLQQLRTTRETNCNMALRKLIKRSCHLLEELGPWAADYFIHASTQLVKETAGDASMLSDPEIEEQQYVADFLSKIPEPDLTDTENLAISPKLGSLIAFLKDVHSPDISGLVFVEQRATVSAMVKLLSVHPDTRDRFRCAPYVGWANSANRRDLVGELINTKGQHTTLAEFRDGRKNLIITTNVLEEGIDVSACSLVVCFNKPRNLKSFIQRRGRARQKKSTYAIMFAMDDTSADLKRWENLEKYMIEAYQNEERRLRDLQALEMLDENVPDELFVESTGAKLTADDALKHLYHFCAILPSQSYGNGPAQPTFSFRQDNDGLVKGVVTLPNCVDQAVRRMTGRLWWHSERAARKDAAFQAYKSLYKHGLLNDHLLPLTEKQEEDIESETVKLPGTVKVQSQWDPWVDVAHAWSSASKVHRTRIEINLNDVYYQHLSMALTGPMELPEIKSIDLFWNSTSTFTLSFIAESQPSTITQKDLAVYRDVTSFYLQAPHSRPPPCEKNDYVMLFSPFMASDRLETWLQNNNGSNTLPQVYANGTRPMYMGLIRGPYNKPYTFHEWIILQQDSTRPEVRVKCCKLPRRRNLLERFLTPNAGDTGDLGHTSKYRTFREDECTVDKFPVIQALFGLFIPLILHAVEKLLVATRLRDTILKDVGFQNVNHIVTAISLPAVAQMANYERYEFLGDCILKFVVSYRLFVQYPRWHEGYLSQSRDATVNNQRLARAALKTGLDAFIITEVLRPRKWSAPLISEKTRCTPGTRNIHRKALADVVEALIGAAYIEGGLRMARICIHTFLPEISVSPPDIASIPRFQNCVYFDTRLQQEIGYKFKDESFLAEALTHPSCDFDVKTQSYQRLEFLGDAVLDMLIVSTITKHSTMEMPPGAMTQLKAAFVNAQLLAFLCMEFGFTTEKTENPVPQVTARGKTTEAGTGTVPFTQKKSTEKIALWTFMRFRSYEIRTARDAAVKRHSLLREEILSSLYNSSMHPWESLSRLNADKFFSDLIESVLGAIFVDSGGNLSECEKFVERIGLLGPLRRYLEESVMPTHPVNSLQHLMGATRVQFRFWKARVPSDGSETTGVEIEDGTEDSRNQQRYFNCSIVTADGKELGSARGCLSKEEAQTRAACAVIKAIQENGLASVAGQNGQGQNGGSDTETAVDVPSDPVESTSSNHS
ncbi:Dicer-like protein 2 [Monascus purpureus]|uniref:Dicer-like protein 2 n=1 Tax=Monascus purpureus TaxID=5098 RepID=A0A507QHK1_MONPU|nr:Dicer-like protein 2 [Monascus purpureus]